MPVVFWVVYSFLVILVIVQIGAPHTNVVSYKIILSNKLLGLLRLGLGLGFGSGFILYGRNYNPNKLLELLNVVSNNFIGLERSDRLNWLKCTNKTNCNLIIFIVPDPCSRNPCYNDGVCRGLGASYTCSCPMGYLGKTCQSMFNLYRKTIPQCKIMALIAIYNTNISRLDFACC